MIHSAFYESSLNSFLAPRLHYSITHTRTQAPSTKVIHSKQNPSIVIRLCKCMMSLFLQNHRHFRALAWKCGQCPRTVFLHSERCPVINYQAQSRLSGPSCGSCRMASLCVWGAWRERQWRECGLLFISDLCQHTAHHLETYLSSIDSLVTWKSWSFPCETVDMSAGGFSRNNNKTGLLTAMLEVLWGCILS